MQYDAVIVGGGPASLACAIRLKQLAILRDKAFVKVTTGNSLFGQCTSGQRLPPFISSGLCAWCVSTNTGTWQGGSSPHQPFQVSSGQGPRTGPNMLRARIQAPMFSKPRPAKPSRESAKL